MFLVLVLISVFAIYKLLAWALSQNRVGDYTNKHVLITGCDSGFGNLLARRLDGLGFNVFAACLTTKGANDLQGDCSQRVTTLILDVTNGKSIADARQFVEARLPAGRGLWGLVNNAGISGIVAPSEWLDRKEWGRCLAVNLLGMVDVTRAFLPLVRQCQGRVVNISSIMGRISALTAPYCASKFGVEAFSDCLRREVSGQGIKVCILEPGFFKTNIMDPNKLFDEYRKCHDATPPEVRHMYPKQTMQSFPALVAKIRAGASERFDKVIDAYELALTSKYPPTRQVIGNDANYLYRPLWNLPTLLTDWILKRL